MNSQKGFSLLLIILIIVGAVAVVGVGAFVYQQYSSNPKPNPNPVVCTPSWTCSWGPCTNGSQSQIATDSNNCGTTTGQIACSTLAQACTTSGQPSVTSISPPQITAGTTPTITLHGSNFNSALILSIIKIAATGQISTVVSPIQVSSDGSTMTFNFPATITAAGNYRVLIGNPGEPDLSHITITLFSSSAQPSITVTSPTANQTITSPVLVKGQSDTFEANVRIKIKDSNGKVLADTYTMGGAYGQSAPYSKSVSYSFPSARGGIVEVFENSAKDGTEINKITTPVIFGEGSIFQTAVTSISPSSASVGAVVTVYGNNFAYTNTGAGTSVMLNGQRIPPNVINNTSLTFIVPAGFQPGTYNLSVSGSAGVSGTLPFTVLSGTQPSITVTSPNGGETLIQGQTYNITWNFSGLNPDDDISLRLDTPNYCSPDVTGCQNSFSISSNFVKNTGSYLWDTSKKMGGGSTGPNTVPVSSNLNYYKIEICDGNVCDSSDNYFSIVAP